MKKFFGLLIGFAIITITLFTSCSTSTTADNSSYTVKQYNVTYVPKVTEDEYSNYKNQELPRESLAVLLLLSQEKPNAEKKTNLTDSELITFLKNNHISEELVEEVLNTLYELPIDAGMMENFSYTIDNEKFYDLYFFEVVN